MILERIAALRAKVPKNGASEEEALAALAMADKLMQKHGVTEKDLNNIEFKRDMREGVHVQKQKQIHPSSKFCASTVSDFCGIRSWTRKADKKKVLRMFGMKGDVEMAEFLMQLIHDSMDRGWKEYLAITPKDEYVSRHVQYWSFMMGFADRVNDKIKELMEFRDVSMSTGNNLVEIKNSVVAQGMEAMLPDLMLRPSRNSSLMANGDAFSAGVQAGDKLNIQRPIQSKRDSTTKAIS